MTDRLTLQAIAQVTGGCRCYRAFNHLLAAGPGWLLAVPLYLLRGEFAQLVDGCPVPHDEVLALIDDIPRQRVMYPPMSPVFSDRVNRLTALSTDDWWFTPMRYPREDSPIGLFSHPCGIRFAATMDVLFAFHPAAAAQQPAECAA
ncbi:hypothetical protein [Chitinimonas sp.]|uniref:hypothetical protein n=1 Tax=Chitinimonas sp. TaxID=1934313 RepID=UPI0035B4EE9B